MQIIRAESCKYLHFSAERDEKKMNIANNCDRNKRKFRKNAQKFANVDFFLYICTFFAVAT